MSQHSKACCTIPPVVTGDYEPKGKYITVDGVKIYTTGPASAKKAILFIFDIFGFYPQTLQGADLLAQNDTVIYMPDWFDGKPAPLEWFPPDTKEKGEALGNFFAGIGAPPKTAGRIPKIVEEIKKINSNIEKWGIVGLCWGGKVVSFCSQSGTIFKAAAEVHPAMVDPKDAAGITIPLAMLASKDEDPEAVEQFEANLKGKKLVKSYPDQIHGFMGARSDLKDPKVAEEYKNGYQLLLQWFHDNL